MAIKPKASEPFGSWLDLEPSGRVKVRHVDYGTSDITILARNDETIVLKVAARRTSARLLQPARYRSPKILVYRVLQVKGDAIKVRPMIEWDLNRNKST